MRNQSIIVGVGAQVLVYQRPCYFSVVLVRCQGHRRVDPFMQISRCNTPLTIQCDFVSVGMQVQDVSGVLCKKHEGFRAALAPELDALGSQTEEQHTCRGGVVRWLVSDALKCELVSTVFSLTQQYVLFEMFYLVLFGCWQDV